MQATAGKRDELTAPYLEEYLHLTGIKVEEIQAWELPVAVGRWAEHIENEREDLLRIIEQAYLRQINL
jgi:hypothetical protein